MTLAFDAPETNHPMFGKISLPEYMDWNRSGKGWGADVVAWHITTKERVESILSNGLNTSACSNWMSGGAERPSAVYLFCAQSVVSANIPALLDNPIDAVILRVVIPAKYTEKLHGDNIYNMSIDAAEMCAIQYRDSIPAEWITVC
jgi:hypothetical protein